GRGDGVELLVVDDDRVDLALAGLVDDERLLDAVHVERELLAVRAGVETGRNHRGARDAVPPFPRHVDLESLIAGEVELLLLLLVGRRAERGRADHAVAGGRLDDAAVRAEAWERRRVRRL